MTRARTIALYTATAATAYVTVASIVEAHLGIHLLPMPFDRAAIMGTINLWLAAGMAHCLHRTLTAITDVETRMVDRLTDFERRLHAHIDSWGVDVLLADQRTRIATPPTRRPSPHPTGTPRRRVLRSVP